MCQARRQRLSWARIKLVKMCFGVHPFSERMYVNWQKLLSQTVAVLFSTLQLSKFWAACSRNILRNKIGLVLGPPKQGQPHAGTTHLGKNHWEGVTTRSRIPVFINHFWSILHASHNVKLCSHQSPGTGNWFACLTSYNRWSRNFIPFSPFSF